MRVYIGSSFSLKDRVQKVHDDLIENGHDVPDVWWDESREQANLKDIDVAIEEDWYRKDIVKKRAKRHFDRIEECDVFVIVAPEGGETKKFNGANIELGYAIATGSECYSVGRLERSAMYEPVTQLGSSRELVAELDRLESVVQ